MFSYQNAQLFMHILSCTSKGYWSESYTIYFVETIVNRALHFGIMCVSPCNLVPLPYSYSLQDNLLLSWQQ